MPNCSYASLLESFDADSFSLSAISNGSTTQSTGLYYFACGMTRGGINLLTSLGQVTVNAGQKLRFTGNSSARPTGLDPFAFVLGAATTNNAVNAKVLAVLYVKEPDQVSDRTLPAYIDLTSDEDFALSEQVEELEDLPSSPVNGAIRYVQEESKFYQWDEEGWHPNTGGDPDWIEVGGWDLYLDDTVTLRSGTLFKGGCDVPIDSFSDEETSNYWGIIPTPTWTSEGSPSPPIKVWLINRLSEGTGNIVPISSQIAFRPAINNDAELGSLLLSAKTEITPTKRIRRSNGSSENLSNAPIVWVAGNPFYTNPSDLNPGYALEFKIVTTAEVGAGDRISFIVYDYGLIGKADNNEAIGTAIFATPAQKARIVPDTVGIKRLLGAGWIDTEDQLGGYSFYAKDELTTSYGIEEDTAGQQVCISGLTNGGITIRQDGEDLLVTEALRALISTEPGTATASSWTNAVSISTNGQLSVLINLPTAIRSNYPDTRIAGSDDGSRQIPFLLPYVRVGGVIKRGGAITVGVGTSQTVIISDTSTWTTVGSLPINSDADFNLWGYGTATASVGGGTGTLAANSYEFAYAWHYPTPNGAVTSISHDPNDGCMVEFAITFAEAIERSQYAGIVSANDTTRNYLENKIPSSGETLVSVSNEGGDESLSLAPRYWRSPVSTKTALKAINPSNIASFEARIVGENLAAYTFDLNSTSTDDNDNVLRPSNNPTTGRWKKISGSGSGGGVTSVATKAALKAVSTQGFTSGLLYLVLENDSAYRFEASVTTGDDNNTILVATDNGGRWKKTGKYNTDEIDSTSTTNKFVTTAEKNAWNGKEPGLGTPGDDGYYLVSTTGNTRNWVAGPSDGTDGWNAYATSSSAIATPAAGTTVTVTLSLGTTTGMAVGQYWTLSDGSFSVSFQVQSIGSTSQVTFLNPASESNLTGTLNSGATTNGVKLVVGGKRGTTGNDGSVTSTSGVTFTSAIAPPSTSASEWKAFINSSDGNNPALRGPSDATTKRLLAIAPSGLANGDIFYYNGTDLVRLAIGSNGQQLSVSGGVIQWATSNQEILSSNRTYYTRSTGDNSTGLSIAAAFTTLTAALDRAKKIITNGFTITIDFTETFALFSSLILNRPLGEDFLILDGNNTGHITSASTNTISRGLIQCNGNKNIRLKRLKISQPHNGEWCVSLICRTGGYLALDTIEFGDLINSDNFTRHCMAESGGEIQFESGYTISGGIGASAAIGNHLFVRSSGIVSTSGTGTQVTTITNTPKFGVFAIAESTGIIQDYRTTYSGSVASGCKKYETTSFGVINQYSASGAYVFPGSIAGTGDGYF